MKQLISNPPYNLKWKHPFFAAAQPRFDLGIPPESNANFAFILSALEISEYAQFILPNGVLTTNQSDEAAIRKRLVKGNCIEAVISLPDNMFVSTSIPTCIIIFNKKKTSSLVSMIDLRKKAEVEVREQRGQFGKQNARVYKKEFNVLPEDMAEQVKKMIAEHLSVAGVCRSVTIKDIEEQDFNLTPSRYIESDKQANIHRPLNDIANDLNRIIDLKNSVKITINENMAKSLEIYDLAVDFKKGEEISKTLSEELSNVGLKIKKTSSLSLTKNKELKIEVKNFERLPEIISVVMNLWRTQMMFFNNEENRLLAELRDALLIELFSGKLLIKNGDGK